MPKRRLIVIARSLPHGRSDTLDQMTAVVAGPVGKRLMYTDLIRPTVRSPVAG